MINREIPFRPRLEGDFRVRFYDAASSITEHTPLSKIEHIIEAEINWVTNECTFNLEQRKKYRAVWYLFRDLIHANWKAFYRDGVLYMSLPSLNGASLQDGSAPEVKQLLRSWMSESRHERLLTFTEFIKHMETVNSNGHSIGDLIADGEELANRIEQAKEGKIALNEAVKPYLQLVSENEKDEFTGLKIAEIWRYFRLTWATPSETTPGRTMQYLIRDAAHPMHAVMGISSLENCAVQITCRDDFIGWNQKAFIDNILNLSASDARVEFEKLLQYIEDGIAGIDYTELCSRQTVENPNDEDIRLLLNLAANAEQQRQDSLRDSTENGYDDDERSDLGSISTKTEQALYNRKRAEQLARLLIAKKAITDVIKAPNFEEIWVPFCKSETGSSVIRNALVAQKTKHIGSSLLELNVCGAIPPYNEILGGKLVALLATSPQVIHDYKERYGHKASEIASRLKGEAVYRPADLVYVGTTSLYYVGSSQYNRLKIPGKIFDTDFDIVWKKLGMTVGFGTMHISKATTQSLTEATSDGFNRINHVFGEGASPKMRLLTMAIRELLEATNEDSKDFSKHAMSRIVYGACLAKNTSDYLLGKADTPDYYTDISQFNNGTQKIIDYWRNRWLKSRLDFEPIYQRIRSFNKADFMVSSQIADDEKWSFTKLEGEQMPANSENQTGLQFIRDFYRGSSAYADHIDAGLLACIHLSTKLDNAIIEAVKGGKDIVLTGNPGDGKTHIIRMLKPSIDQLDLPVKIILDASTLSNSEIYQSWHDARESGKSYIIAVNAAVLYSVFKEHEDFAPLAEAYKRMTSSVVFHDESENDGDVIVFDLSKREVLTPDIIAQAICKMTDEQHYHECDKCPLKPDCVVTRNRKLLNEKRFQERLYTVLERVALKGYHATLRELQGLVSYLLFGNRSCKKLNQTAGNDTYDISNLIYSGKGGLFDAIRGSIDPVKISHPIWDERLIQNDVTPDTWVENFVIPAESIAYDNETLFKLRKRQFFFFNKHGEELLSILDDDATRFQHFLAQDDKKIIKELIRKINAFFGSVNPSNSELQIWSGHRFDNEPRKVLISVGIQKANSFLIGRPTLAKSMQAGIAMTTNYVRLEKKHAAGTFLKIDFAMYLMLTEAERGVPVLFLESDLVKKVWRFIELLQSYEEVDEDVVTVNLLDIQNKKRIDVTIDREDKKYTSIKSYRMEEG